MIHRREDLATKPILYLFTQDNCVNCPAAKAVVSEAFDGSDIVDIEFNKEAGETFEKGQILATIESVKAAADVNSPISGKVLEVNESLSDTPEVLNDDPYENGWLFKVELNNPSELDELFDAKGYDEFCESRH